MASGRPCEEIRALAPELALGILGGKERARIVSHISVCSGCRGFVEELSTTADEVLLLAPSHEPPVGFETRVLSTLELVRRRKRRSPLALVAALLLGAAVASAGLLAATRDERELASSYRRTLATADGRYFGAHTLQVSGGGSGGHLFVYDGAPSWLWVVIDRPVRGARYDAHIETREGRRIDLGSFVLSGERRSWGTEVGVAIHDIATFVVSPRGRKDTLWAEFGSS